MSTSPDSLPLFEHWLPRLHAGDQAAWNEILPHLTGRLEQLTRKMLRGFPGVRRWEQTDDVLQNALLRLHRSLGEVRPESLAQFLGLAATQIRRELIDLARHYYGPHGLGAHHATDAPAAASGAAPRYEQAANTEAPGQLLEWAEFHGQVQGLPDEERAVFDLLWYHGLTQAEAARALGVNERTVKRRWRSARLRLHEVWKGECLDGGSAGDR